MNKGYWVALAFFVLGFICTLALGGGKQVVLASVSFITSAFIAQITYLTFVKNKGKRY